MAAKSAQPNRYRKGKDIKVGDMILMGRAWELTEVVEIVKVDNGRVYSFRSATPGLSIGANGHEFVEGSF